MLEKIFTLVEEQSMWVTGFVMAGVILILIGIKNVTSKEMREYKLSHTNLHKIDEIIAWGVFYIIFGGLILAGAIFSFYPYIAK